MKYERQILLTAAYFHMRQPFFYPRALQAPDSFCTTNLAFGEDFAAGDLCFESDGHETHDGVEVSAQGKSRNLDAVDRFARGDSRAVRRYRHACVQRQAGNQRATLSVDVFC